MAFAGPRPREHGSPAHGRGVLSPARSGAPHREIMDLQRRLREAQDAVRSLQSTASAQREEIARLKDEMERTRELSALLASQRARAAAQSASARAPAPADAIFTTSPAVEAKGGAERRLGGETGPWGPLPDIFSDDELQRFAAALDAARGNGPGPARRSAAKKGPCLPPTQRTGDDAAAGPDAGAKTAGAAPAVPAPQSRYEDQILRLQAMVSVLVEQRATLQMGLDEARRELEASQRTARRESALRAAADKQLAAARGSMQALKMRCSELEDRTAAAETAAEEATSARARAEAAAARAAARAEEAAARCARLRDDQNARAEASARARSALLPVRAALRAAQRRVLEERWIRWRVLAMGWAWASWARAAGPASTPSGAGAAPATPTPAPAGELACHRSSPVTSAPPASAAGPGCTGAVGTSAAAPGAAAPAGSSDDPSSHSGSGSGGSGGHNSGGGAAVATDTGTGDEGGDDGGGGPSLADLASGEVEDLLRARQPAAARVGWAAGAGAGGDGKGGSDQGMRAGACADAAHPLPLGAPWSAATRVETLSSLELVAHARRAADDVTRLVEAERARRLTDTAAENAKAETAQLVSTLLLAESSAAALGPTPPA